MERVHYNDLVDRFGKDMANKLVRCLEQLAQIQNDIIEFDSDKRLEKALAALNDSSPAVAGNSHDRA
jgi:hypothetical protein